MAEIKRNNEEETSINYDEYETQASYNQDPPRVETTAADHSNALLDVIQKQKEESQEMMDNHESDRAEWEKTFNDWKEEQEKLSRAQNQTIRDLLDWSIELQKHVMRGNESMESIQQQMLHYNKTAADMVRIYFFSRS